MSINKGTLSKVVNNQLEFIYPKTTADLVQYGSSTVKDILDNLDNTYLTISNASNTYLSIDDASNTYLTISNASNTYLSIDDASNTYATIEWVDENYGKIDAIKVNGSPIVINNDKSVDITIPTTANDLNAYTKTNVDSLLDNKVDKIDGKNLSTNDYTTAEKDKLAGIAVGATKVEQGSTMGTIKVNNVDIDVYDDSEIYAELDSNYLKKTDASNTYLTKTGKAASATSADSATKATQDGSGNTITSTYLKLSGGTLTGYINIANAGGIQFVSRVGMAYKWMGNMTSTDGLAIGLYNADGTWNHRLLLMADDGTVTFGRSLVVGYGITAGRASTFNAAVTVNSTLTTTQTIYCGMGVCTANEYGVYGKNTSGTNVRMLMVDSYSNIVLGAKTVTDLYLDGKDKIVSNKTITVSYDRRLKRDITALDSRHTSLFDRLRPVTYRIRDEDSG